MMHHLKNHFIPHRGNNYLPRALHPRSLSVYAVVLLGAKILLVAGLAWAYPTPQAFAELSIARVVELANQDRAKFGAQALSVNVELTQAAQAKADDMLTKGYFAHYAPDGTTPWYFFRNANYLYVYAGENLAMNFVDTDRVHSAWMASPSHRDNILNPVYRDIGVAVKTGTMNGKTTTVMVQLFGARSAVASGQEFENTAPIETPLATTATEKVDGEETSSALQESDNGFLGFLSAYVDMIYWVLGAFLIIALALKIFINIRIQHHSVIAQTVILALVIGGMLSTQIHFLEHWTSRLAIL